MEAKPRDLSEGWKGLPTIPTSEIDALALMLENNFLNQMYTYGLGLANYNHLVEYLRISARKQLHMSFLEIGAGTGGAAMPILEFLAHPEGVLVDRYLYSEVSRGFFDQARATVADYLNWIKFKILEIKKDSLEQE